MRIIKFRVWDKEIGMIYIEHVYSALSSAFSDRELMQFTGHYDKNKVEVYEEDIVRVSWRDLGKHKKEMILTVRWNGNGYGNVFERKDYKVEVIGNTWANSELRKGEKL